MNIASIERGAEVTQVAIPADWKKIVLKEERKIQGVPDFHCKYC